MTMEEMRTAADRLRKINAALELLNKRRAWMKELSRIGRQKPIVKVSFVAEAKNQWGRYEAQNFVANLPMAVLVQQAHYEVMETEREIVTLGGIVPPAEKW